MKRILLLVAVLLVMAACSPADTAATSTTVADSTTIPEPDFPVTLEDSTGEVTIDDQPESVISLSATATEMLFAIGAGPLVVAVDDQSNYPADAPMTDLSGFTPNVEAILAYEPDLVVIQFDPGDLVASLETAGVDVITLGPAGTVDDVYTQMQLLGEATGQYNEAAEVTESLQEDMARVVDGTADGEGITYYHEIDNTLFTATSATFTGQIYALFGLENIADEADADGSAFGYPQLSSEYVVGADPDIIFLANSLYGETPETVSVRPGWDVLSAVQEGNIVELDSDVASRWGPRIVDLAASVSDAIDAYLARG